MRVKFIFYALQLKLQSNLVFHVYICGIFINVFVSTFSPAILNTYAKCRCTFVPRLNSRALHWPLTFTKNITVRSVTKLCFSNIK